jgi:hypothetical protein
MGILKGESSVKKTIVPRRNIMIRAVHDRVLLLRTRRKQRDKREWCYEPLIPQKAAIHSLGKGWQNYLNSKEIRMNALPRGLLRYLNGNYGQA